MDNWSVILQIPLSNN